MDNIRNFFSEQVIVSERVRDKKFEKWIREETEKILKANKPVSKLGMLSEKRTFVLNSEEIRRTLVLLNNGIDERYHVEYLLSNEDMRFELLNEQLTARDEQAIEKELKSRNY